ncbi:MAG: hypothetical protein DI536_29025 [Archangium gephyra]|uniref:DNA polymerase III beta sliding clamp central domain-containing protein n=1 Tax=Archangium gephyra TaxID=48 RepID=A0A2W5SWC0_9BACT|nr:MAG: hypothetical protein DI536_29025 [Archangium gephyra]
MASNRFTRAVHLKMLPREMARLLEASIVCVSDDLDRYVLHHVYFEADGGKSRLISTDGHMLSVITGPESELEIVEPLCLHSEIVKKLVAGLKRFPRGVKELAELSIDVADKTVRCRVVVRDSLHSMEWTAERMPGDGEFPEWRRLLPYFMERATLNESVVNPVLLARMARIARSLGTSQVRLTPAAAADKALRWCGDAKAIGVEGQWKWFVGVMPMSEGTEHTPTIHVVLPEVA